MFRHVACRKDLMFFRLLFLLNAISNISVSKLYYECSTGEQRKFKKLKFLRTSVRTPNAPLILDRALIDQLWGEVIVFDQSLQL